MPGILRPGPLRIGGQGLRVASGPAAVVVPPVESWTAAVQADLPGAWYRHNEASGTTARDTSANGRDTSYLGTPVVNVAGAPTLEDKAFTLDGTDDQMAVPAAVAAMFSTASTSAAETWAVELIVAPSATVAGSAYFVSLGNTADNDPILGVVTENVGGAKRFGLVYRLDDGIGVIAPIGGPTINDDLFHHVVLECDGTTVSLYVDRTLAASAPAPTGATATFNTGAVGCLARVATSAFSKGLVDESVFYDHALGLTRVQAHYDAFQSGAFQVFDGAGTTFRSFKGDGSDVAHPEGHPDMWNGNAVVLTSGQEDAIHALLYNATTGLGLSRLRDNEPTTGTLPGITAPNTFSVESANDDADPNVQTPGGFDFTGPRCNDQAAYAAKAKANGAAKSWWGPIARETWMTLPTSATPNATDVAERAEWLLAIIRQRAARGAPLDYFHVGNEPDYTTSPMSGEFIRDTIKNLCPRLAAEGLTTRVVLGPFNKSSTALARIDTVMADATARQYVVAIGFHGYDEASTNIANLKYRAEKWNIPLWETELSKTTVSTMADQTNSDIGWAKAAQDILTLYNAATLDFMMAAYGSQETNSLVILSYSGASYSGAAIRAPLGYYFMQFSKYIRRGHQRVRITSSDANVKVSAWRRPSDGQVVIVAVNPTAGALTPTLTCSRLAGKTTSAVTRSSGTESNAAQSAQAIAGSAFSPVLPAASVSTFVAP